MMKKKTMESSLFAESCQSFHRPIIALRMNRLNPDKQSLRKQNDAYLMEQIKQVWQDSGCRYGIRKVWHNLKQDGLAKLAR